MKNKLIGQESENTGTAKPSVTKASVYLIDDHPMIVQGISLLIDAEPDMKVVGSSSVWTVALKEIEKLKPDVVLLDVTLANANGVEVLKNLKVHVPEQKVLMLSMHDENLYAVRAMKAGANGYLMKASATAQQSSGPRAAYWPRPTTKMSLRYLVCSCDATSAMFISDAISANQVARWPGGA